MNAMGALMFRMLRRPEPEEEPLEELFLLFPLAKEDVEAPRVCDEPEPDGGLVEVSEGPAEEGEEDV